MDTEFDSAFSYHPPPGGDISLKSSNGDIFLAHSLILRLASSVFADMFSTATQKDVVELSDDAESVSLMLRFIYPPPFLESLPAELLEKSLRIAQKYDVGAIITSIDHVLVSQSSHGSGLTYSDPIDLFCLAVKYGLPKTQIAAAEAIRPGHYAFKTVSQIKLLAETYANAAGAIGLLGAHCIHTYHLSDLLFGNHRYLLHPDTEEEEYIEGRIMMCRPCYDHAGYDSINPNDYVPIWFVHWTTLAFRDLSSKPLEECGRLFNFSILETISMEPNTCRQCLDAAHAALGGSAFRSWAQTTREMLYGRLRGIEVLYNL
ncbi:hypothetical protein FRC12_008553 [Ceratobasidium sp. 428]|nr:hypothetical protein FRC12_008553 [Ceratobasidium sp. 428]